MESDSLSPGYPPEHLDPQEFQVLLISELDGPADTERALMGQPLVLDWSFWYSYDAVRSLLDLGVLSLTFSQEDPALASLFFRQDLGLWCYECERIHWYSRDDEVYLDPSSLEHQKLLEYITSEGPAEANLFIRGLSE